MRINILSIGKFRTNDPNRELFEEYRRRLPFPVKLLELAGRPNPSNLELEKEAEAEIILQNIGKKSKVVALDERGKIIGSPEFAQLLERYNSDGFSDIDFVIGGSNGLGKKVLERADFLLSFGKMVFPHLLVRVMLMEQIYRAHTIKSGTGYHK